MYPVGTSEVLILELQDKQLLVENTSVNPPSGEGGSRVFLQGLRCAAANAKRQLLRGASACLCPAVAESSKDVKAPCSQAELEFYRAGVEVWDGAFVSVATAPVSPQTCFI